MSCVTAQIIKDYNEDNYIERAESEVGPLHLHDWEFEEVPDNPGFSRLVEKETEEEKKHNRKVFNRARKIEKEEWKLEILLDLYGNLDIN